MTSTALVAIRCFGAQDEIGPICTGPDIRSVIAREPYDGTWFQTHWCLDCRQAAIEMGYEILEFTQ